MEPHWHGSSTATASNARQQRRTAAPVRVVQVQPGGPGIAGESDDTPKDYLSETQTGLTTYDSASGLTRQLEAQ